MNTRKFTFTGLRRSGNHPIIHWIFACFNNGEILTESKTVGVWVDKNNKRYFLNDWWNQYGYTPPSTLEMIMYSYEDRHLNYTKFYTDPEFTNIILLRDPLNTFASRIKDKMYEIPWYIKTKEQIEVWKEYAREALGLTNKTTNTIVILYNKWLFDEGYRKEIANKLGTTFVADTLYVPPNGKGSSFIGRELEKNIQNYEFRYKMVTFPQDYITLMNDPDLIEYSQELFPSINILEAIKGLAVAAKP